jgi:hypothetical protein
VRIATGARHDPNIVGVSESDLGGTDGRSAKESSLTSVSVLGFSFREKKQKAEDEHNGQGKAGKHVIISSKDGAVEMCDVDYKSLPQTGTKTKKIMCFFVAESSIPLYHSQQTHHRGERS